MDERMSLRLWLDQYNLTQSWLRSGRTETMLTMQDFEYQIERYMGFEALLFFQELWEEIKAERHKLSKENDDYRRSSAV